MKPSVSIIMPCYNHALYIREAIESVLKQTFGNFEIIIHDDGSEDDSLKIIKEYQKKDSQIKVIVSPKNIGIANSYNRLINEAKGKYIAVMETDDISLPNRLEVQHRFMESHPNVDILTSRYLHFGDDIYQSAGKLYSPEEIRAGLLFGCAIANLTVFFRKNYMRNIGFTYDTNIFSANDYDFFVKALLHKTHPASFYMLPDILVKYRKHPVNTTIVGLKSGKTITDLRIIHTNILKRLGIEVTEENLNSGLYFKNIHNFSPLSNQLSDSELLSRNKTWIETMVSANRKTLKIDEKTFKCQAIILMYNNIGTKNILFIWSMIKDCILYPPLFTVVIKHVIHKVKVKLGK